MARPRIKRSVVNELTQSQRIIRTLSMLYDASYNEVQRLYYGKGECIQAVKLHYKFNQLNN